MNELVEYLFKHYHSGGHTCRPVLVNKLLKDGPFSRKKIYQMAGEAHQAGLMLLEFTYENGHYFPSQYTSEDLDTIALTRKGLGR